MSWQISALGLGPFYEFIHSLIVLHIEFSRVV